MNFLYAFGFPEKDGYIDEDFVLFYSMIRDKYVMKASFALQTIQKL